MKKQTKIQLQKIYDNTTEILFLYSTLAKLEVLNKQNSKEYKNIIELLFLKIENEQELYKYFQNNLDELSDTSCWLLDKIDNGEEFDLYDYIIDQNENELMHQRIYYRLDSILDSYDYWDYDFNKNYTHLNDGIDPEFFNKYIGDYVEILNDSLVVRLVSYLENTIKQEENAKNRYYLIKARLYASFLSKDLETKYLKNSFQKIDNIFEKDIVNNYDMLETDIEIKNRFGQTILDRAVTFFDYFIDPDSLLEQETYQESLIYTGLLTSSLLYLSNNELELLNNHLLDYVDNLNVYGYEDDDLDDDLETSDKVLEMFEDELINDEDSDLTFGINFAENLIINSLSMIDEIKEGANSDIYNYGSKEL